MSAVNPEAAPALAGRFEQRFLALAGGGELRDLERLRTVVAALSDGFTTNREGRPAEYFVTAENRAAYGLFYFPQTLARTRFALDELWRRGWRPPGPGAKVLDLGAGLGAAGFAAADFLRERGCAPALEARDAAPAALRELRALADDALPDVPLETRVQDLRDCSESGANCDLILCSFAINEAFEARPEEELRLWLRRQLDALAPRGVLLLLEPALRETSERLVRLREWSSAGGYAGTWAPCPHERPCPMLAAGAAWCHEVRAWTPPAPMQFINRTLHRDIGVLKFSFLALSPSPPPPLPADPDRFRLVSPVAELKGRHLMTGCASDGQLRRYDLLARHLDRPAAAALRAFERGDRLVALGGENRAGDLRRIKGLTPAD